MWQACNCKKDRYGQGFPAVSMPPSVTSLVSPTLYTTLLQPPPFPVPPNSSPSAPPARLPPRPPAGAVNTCRLVNTPAGFMGRSSRAAGHSLCRDTHCMSRCTPEKWGVTRNAKLAREVQCWRSCQLRKKWPNEPVVSVSKASLVPVL